MDEIDNQEDTKQKTTAADLVNQLRRGKQLYEEFSQEFRTKYQIQGKLLSEWREHFKLTVPPDVDPQLLRETGSKLLDLHHEASFLKADAQNRLAAYKSRNKRLYEEQFTALVTEYKAEGKKLPAKDTLATLVNNELAYMNDGVIHLEIELSFWKEILTSLYEVRKIIESETWNLSLEAKALQNERLTD